MKDSRGNEFVAGDVLVSSQAPTVHHGVTCISTDNGVARLRWNVKSDGNQEFMSNQDQLDSSHWIKKEE